MRGDSGSAVWHQSVTVCWRVAQRWNRMVQTISVSRAGRAGVCSIVGWYVLYRGIRVVAIDWQKKLTIECRKGV